MKIFLIGVALILGLAAGCKTAVEVHHHDEEEAHGEEEFSSVGPEKAVLEASREKGFRLSPEAIRILGIEWKELSGSPPDSALVFYQDKVGVYRLREGMFQLIPSSEKLQKGDAVATRGVSFLRVTEMELFGERVEGHGH